MSTAPLLAAQLHGLQSLDAESQNVRIIVETPAGSRNKYDFNPEFNALEFGKVLPQGMSFPYDFGFVPATLGEDGDPLDALVLMDAPAIPGCIVTCRMLGVFEAQQKEADGKWTGNDRFLAVPVHTCIYAQMKAISDLPAQMLRDLQGFFVNYAALEQTKFRIRALGGPRKAMRLLRAGMQEFKRKQSKGGG